MALPEEVRMARCRGPGRGRRKNPVLRPRDLKDPLPGLNVDTDPEIPVEPEVDKKPFAKYLEKAAEIDKEIASDRVAKANERYK